MHAREKKRARDSECCSATCVFSTVCVFFLLTFIDGIVFRIDQEQNNRDLDLDRN